MPRYPRQEPAHSGRQPGSVSALKRGFAVLRCFEESASPLSNGEIARLTGIPKPTVTRLIATLASLGYVRQAPGTEKYTLGARVITLAQSFLSSLDVRAAARPHMLALAEAIGGWSYLATRNGLEMVLIEACRSRSGVLLSRLVVGSRIPMANSALGRAYLGGLPPRDRSAMVEQIRSESGEHWPKLRTGLRLALREGEAKGYYLSAGEWHRDVHSIAVRLPLPGGEMMALNCGGPAFAFSIRRLRTEAAPRLLDTASIILQEIGGMPPDTGRGIPDAPARARASRLRVKARD
jgi:IclR family transcriptional regulator, positive regulator for flagellar biogenesis